MRVLGIDPGSRVTGLGIVESANQSLVALHSENLRLGGGPLPQRLGEIYRRISALVEEFAPDTVAVEQVFVASNARSALTLGHARGSAICSAVNEGCDVSEYSALQIKRAVVGTGSATKEQVQHMVRVLLGLRSSPGADAADALACAICHIHTAEVTSRLGRAMAQ